tara:strand:- start:2661 stop:3059 length:399 start_codon:yes stop_codon:yes gene_type:complete
MAKQMIKRKDGSYSQRGLWDNIRANKGSGKKPTKQMLEQEKKIKNKKEMGGTKKKLYKKGGKSAFGMLSVKAGVDNNPNPTAADRIVGAKKNKKKKGGKKKMMGGGMKKMYKTGGFTLEPKVPNIDDHNCCS